MRRFIKKAHCHALLLGNIAFCQIASASVESTLTNIQTRLISTILPLFAILGLVYAGFSFVMGSPNAKQHLFLAIMGAVIGFMAPSIVDLIRSVVH